MLQYSIEKTNKEYVTNRYLKWNGQQMCTYYNIQYSIAHSIFYIRKYILEAICFLYRLINIEYDYNTFLCFNKYMDEIDYNWLVYTNI